MEEADEAWTFFTNLKATMCRVRVSWKLLLFLKNSSFSLHDFFCFFSVTGNMEKLKKPTKHGPFDKPENQLVPGECFMETFFLESFAGIAPWPTERHF